MLFKKIKFSYLCISLFSIIFFFIAFFFNDIKKIYFWIAYKEHCLISTMNTKKNINLEDASKVCQCMKKQITVNKDRLNTSKLQTETKTKDKDGKLKPIDQVNYLPLCFKKYGLIN